MWDFTIQGKYNMFTTSHPPAKKEENGGEGLENQHLS